MKKTREREERSGWRSKEKRRVFEKWTGEVKCEWQGWFRSNHAARIEQMREIIRLLA